MAHLRALAIKGTVLEMREARVTPMACPRFRVGFGGAFRPQNPEKLYGIGAQGPGNCNELDDIDAAFATLILGNKRLGSSKLLGQGLLTHARAHVRTATRAAISRLIFRGFEGLLHGPPSQGIGGTAI